MIRRLFSRAVASLLLGMAVAGAVAMSASPVGAQVRPDSVRRAPPDSVQQDTAAIRAAQDSVREAAAKAAAKAAEDSVRNALAQARLDSIYRAKLADTLKAPFAHFETADQAEFTDRLRFTRDEILSSGATNLADLLDYVPGVTTFRTRWITGMHVAALNGDFHRMRVFFDGIERDPIEARQGRVLDLADIPLWNLDEIVIERMPGEIRVWLRGWTVRKTTPYTRVDIFTGDLNTNGFRALFARRFGNGFALQFVGQQTATQTGRVSMFPTGEARVGSGDGDQQVIDVRTGWARGKLTIDGQATGIARTRDSQLAREGYTDLPSFKGSRREGYARIAYGDSLRGFFTQALVGVLRTRLQGNAGVDTIVLDTTEVEPASRDTVRAQTQQLVTAGYRAEWWHASLLDRVRPVSGTSYHAPAVRAGLGRGRLTLMGYAERRSLDSLSEVDLSAVARPLPWLSLIASQSWRSPIDDTTRNASSSTRLETAVRFAGLWFGGGVMRDGATQYASFAPNGASPERFPSVATSGLVASVRGPLYKDLRLDVNFIRWDQAQYERPRMAVHSELALISSWLSRFPRGQFGINTRIIYDMRAGVPFYWGAGVEPIASLPSHVVTGLLEIRIQSMTLFYQYRNLTGQDYEQFPGLTMPPAVQMYGMRWEFWN